MLSLEPAQVYEVTRFTVNNSDGENFHLEF